MDDDVAAFAETFRRFSEAMHELASQTIQAPVRDRLDGFLGEATATLPVVAETFPPYDHVNVQVALDAYLAGEGRSHELIGLTGQQRRFMSLADLVASGHYSGVAIGSVDYTNLPIGPSDTLACVSFGLYLVEDRGIRLVILVRTANEDMGQGHGVTLEVVCRDRDAARARLAEIRRLMVERNVFRGQLISFGESPLGHVTLGPIVFHRRPNLDRASIVLPEGVLEQIERQVFGIAEQRERLRAGDQHVKRGLLLHGPPGTGKTLTARYVSGRAVEHTIVVLTGAGLGLVRAACSLARMLQPGIVILEDIDLVAQHRTYGEYGSNPLLFDVLNEMDGIEEDADVAFLLTTNRADLLEPALAARPGRVDLAVDIPLPDAGSRRRLLELYARGVQLRVRDPDSIVTATAGVTASFMKELIRKASLAAALRDGSSDPLQVVDEDLESALGELLDESNTLTRALLGAGGPRPGTEWLTAGEE